jgi:hypothetical protein
MLVPTALKWLYELMEENEKEKPNEAEVMVKEVPDGGEVTDWERAVAEVIDVEAVAEVIDWEFRGAPGARVSRWWS